MELKTNRMLSKPTNELERLMRTEMNKAPREHQLRFVKALCDSNLYALSASMVELPDRAVDYKVGKMPNGQHFIYLYTSLEAFELGLAFRNQKQARYELVTAVNSMNMAVDQRLWVVLNHGIDTEFDIPTLSVRAMLEERKMLFDSNSGSVSSDTTEERKEQIAKLLDNGSVDKAVVAYLRKKFFLEAAFFLVLGCLLCSVALFAEQILPEWVMFLQAFSLAVAAFLFYNGLSHFHAFRELGRIRNGLSVEKD